MNKIEFEKYLEKNGACIAYFSDNACNVCEVLYHKVDDLITNEFPKMDLIRLEKNNNQEIFSEYMIMSSPVIIVFFDGKETLRFGRNMGLSELSDKVSRYYNMFFE